MSKGSIMKLTRRVISLLLVLCLVAGFFALPGMPNPGVYAVAGPVVINVTSDMDDTVVYKTGDTIDIKVIFDQVVNVNLENGVLGLELNLGPGKYAEYFSGSSTDTLIFRYIVQNGDAAMDLDYVSNNSLQTDGGLIEGAPGINAVLTLPAPGNIGSLGYNKEIKIDTQSIVTVPYFEINDADDIYQGMEPANIILADTGKDVPTVVYGSTTYLSGANTVEVPFKVVFNPSQIAGSLILNANFVNEADVNSYLSPDDILAEQQPNNAIPVNQAVYNTITLSYTYNVDQLQQETISTTLQWSPGQTGGGPGGGGGGGIWQWTQPVGNLFSIGPNSATVDVKIGGFTGTASNLRVEGLYTVPNTDPPETITTFVLRNVQLISEETVDQTVEKVYRFSYQTDSLDTNRLNEAGFNDNNLRLVIIYEDSVNSINQQQDIAMVRVDNRPPDPNADFGGLESNTGTYQGYYMIRAWLNDDVHAGDLIANKDNWFKRVSGDVQQSPSAVIPIRNDGDTRGENDPYNMAILYFQLINSGDSIQINGITDIAGNTMTQLKTNKIFFQTHVAGTVQILGSAPDYSFMPVPNAEIELVNVQLFMNPRQSDGGQFTDDGFRMIRTDANGNLVDFEGNPGYYLEPGEYHLIGIRYNAGSASLPDYREISLDENISIPVLGQDETHTLNIQQKAPNVSGSVETDGSTPEKSSLLFMKTEYIDPNGEWAGFEDEQMLYESFGKIVDTEDSGAFSLYLSPGTYTLVGKLSGFSFISPVNAVTFTVPAEGNHIITNTIQFPDMNVTGVIKKADDSPVSNAMISIRKLSSTEEMPFSAMTSSNGSFAAALSDGSYAIDAAVYMWENTGNGGMYMLDVTFDVVDGQVQNVSGSDQTGNSLAGITIPSPNVTVNITRGGVPIDREISLSLKMGSGDKGPWMSSNTGSFDFYLTPGTYTIDKLSSPPDVWIDGLNKVIIAEADTNYTGANAIIIDALGQSNVIISVEDDQGNAVSGVGIQIEGTNNGVWEWRETGSDGRAYFNLKSGQYKINGYNYNNNWNQYDSIFTVTDTNTEETPVLQKIVIKAPNVQGVVRDEGGQPVVNGWLNIKKLPSPGELFDEHFGAPTDINGEFSASLGAGDYLIEGIGTKTGWKELNFKFFIVDVNGNLETRLTKAGSAVESLTVQKPADNMKGFVYKGYNGSEPVKFTGRTQEQNYDPNWPTDVWLVLRQYGIDEATFNQMPWYYEKWVEVEADGSFGTTVDAAKKYIPRAIVDAGQWLEIDASAVTTQPLVQGAVVDGALVPDVGTVFVIVPPAANFSGIIQDYDGNPVTKGWLNVEKLDAKGNSIEWVGIDIGSDGTFGKGLTAGANYIIREASIMTNDPQDPWRDAVRIAFNKKVIIGQDTADMILKPNVKGTINLGYQITSTDQWYQPGAIIRPVIANQDPNYQDFLQNPWKYERWVNLTYVDSNTGDSLPGAYVFHTYLEPGSYKLVGIPSPNKWIELNGELTVIDAAAQEFTFDCTPNVTGTISKAGNLPIANAWVNIEKDIPMDPNTPNQWDPSRYFGTNTDLSGDFGLKLENGDYKIAGYSTPGQWAGNTWQPGSWVQLNYRFKVIGGVLHNSAEVPVPIARINIASNVTGIVMKIFKAGKDNAGDFVGTPADGQYAQAKDAWMTIKPVKLDGQGNEYVDYTDWSDTIHANTGGSGEFSLMLGAGKYMVIDAGMKDNWMKLEIPFVVGADSVLQDLPDDYVIDGKLVIKPQQPNFKGIAYKDANKINPVKWGWMAVKPKNAKEQDWSSVVWVNTKEDGSFEIKLADGEWKVTEINGPGYWLRVNIPFNVAGSVVTSTLNGVVQSDGTVRVSPLPPNLTGYIKDESGSAINQSAWITIKPASAGPNDWDGSFGMEYRDKDGDGSFEFAEYLGEGSYKIVNVGGMNFWYETNIRFNISASGQLVQVDDGTVVNSKLIISPPTPNVTGSAYTGADTSSPVVQNGWMGFARYDVNGVQLTWEGQAITPENGGWKAPGDDIYWNHTRWTEINNAGQFRFRMEDGYYKVISVNGMSTWYRPDTGFQVVGGDLKAVGGTDITTLDVTLPGPNMTVVVQNSTASGGNVNDDRAWIDVKDLTNGFVFSVESNAKNGSGDFIFELRLKSGDHQVVSFSTPSMWTEVDSGLFKANDPDFFINLGTQDKEVVNGVIYSEGATALSGAWISIQKVEVENGVLSGEKKWVQTNNAGQFSFKLNAGETWAVVDITTANGYEQLANPVNDTDYTVVDTSEDVQTGWNLILSSLNLQP